MRHWHLTFQVHLDVKADSVVDALEAVRGRVIVTDGRIGRIEVSEEWRPTDRTGATGSERS